MKNCMCYIGTCGNTWNNKIKSIIHDNLIFIAHTIKYFV